MIFALKVGITFKDKLKLVLYTLLFHVSNISIKFDRNKIECFNIKLLKCSKKLYMRPFNGDLFVFYEVLMDHSYYLPIYWLKNINTVVDLGSHIGFTTFYLSQFAHNTKFYCVEPNENNLKLLKCNLASINDKVSIINGAIYHKSGEKYFNNNLRSWEGSISDNESSVKVRCYTVSEIFNMYKLSDIDILKVDVEGAEKYLFKSDNDWLYKVKIILIELHSDYHVKEFKNDISKYEFTVFPPNAHFGNNVLIAVKNDFLEKYNNIQ